MSEILFNDNWQFMLKEVGSEYPEAAAGTEWHDVEVPHDWLIGDTANLYKSGDGWYKKTFTIDQLSEEDRYILRFDGVYTDSTVYVNGMEAGGRKYGYSCFSLDITPRLDEGENEIFVRVRYRSPDSRWYTGAGIYRSVWLRKARSEAYIAENGVYIAVKPHADKWIVIIETTTEGLDCTVRHNVFDRKGNKLAEVYARQKKGFSRAAFCASRPRLWDIDSPYSYIMETEIMRGGEKLDTARNIFGFRSTQFDPDRGFLLNNRRLKLHGVCLHHDLGCLGAAVNVHAVRRRLKILKSFGVNAIRTAHNMPARELIDLCTQMGIMVVSECFDIWEEQKTEFDYSHFFAENFREDVKSWITRDRNAPCVIMWSIGNEIYDTHKSERGLETAKLICGEINELDRYANASCTIASNYMRWGNAQRVADFVKLAGYNYAEDLYDGHHEAYPDWFIYGSETASTVRSRGIFHGPAGQPILIHPDHQCSDYGNSIVGWGKSSEQAIIDDRDKYYCGGQFVWSGFDYIGEPTPYDTKSSYFGIVDTAGFPKASYYLYKAAWAGKTEEPFVHILPYWDHNNGEEMTVMTYSNMEDVELLFNGMSLGIRHVDLAHGDKLHCEWKLKYKRGKLTANALNKDGSTAATDTVSSFGEPESIDAVPDKYIMNADGRDLIFIEISVADRNGVFAANARNRVKVTVEGAARLVGLDNGDSTDTESYKADNRRLFGGKLLAVIQSTFEAGEATVTIKSEGMWSKVITFTSFECEKPAGVSVVKEYYPKVTGEYRHERPLRKIELYATRNILDPDNPTAGITAKLLPENADYDYIEFSCIKPNGTPAELSEVVKTPYGAKITGKGDGKYIIRATCKNGTKYPQIVSDLTFVNKGFGSLTLDPYAFVSMAHTGYSSRPLSILAGGMIRTGNERTSFCFDNVDFGKTGSERIILSCGHYEQSGDIPIELWIDDPDHGGKVTATLDFKYNGCFERCERQEFGLPERIKGVCSIAFVVSRNMFFGGFEFIPVNKAFDRRNASENDEIYGDEYHVAGGSITDIGNNVSITFNGLDFGEEGTRGLTVCGRTVNEINPIQLRYRGEDGKQSTSLLDFKQAFDHTEQHFSIGKITGKNDVSFVFMPGSKFDLDWFEFDK